MAHIFIPQKCRVFQRVQPESFDVFSAKETLKLFCQFSVFISKKLYIKNKNF